VPQRLRRSEVQDDAARRVEGVDDAVRRAARAGAGRALRDVAEQH
jgi:hypothetical protein